MCFLKGERQKNVYEVTCNYPILMCLPLRLYITLEKGRNGQVLPKFFPLILKTNENKDF